MKLRIEDLPEEYQKQAKRQLAGNTAQSACAASGRQPATRIGKPPAKQSRKASTMPVGKAGRMNQTERRFQSDVLNGQGEFEAVTFRLPGGSRYTPDFVLVRRGDSGEWEIEAYEVKGKYRLHSQGRALTAWREARAAFPWVTFRWFTLTTTDEGFKEKYTTKETR